jgi:hypothetical protein
MHAVRWPNICEISGPDQSLPDTYDEDGNAEDTAHVSTPPSPNGHKYKYTTHCVCSRFVKAIGCEWGLALEKRRKLEVYRDQKKARLADSKLRTARETSLKMCAPPRPLHLALLTSIFRYSSASLGRDMMFCSFGVHDDHTLGCL